MTINGSLLKGVFERKFRSPVENGPQNGDFSGKKGIKLNFWFLRPPKGTSCDIFAHTTARASATARGRMFGHLSLFTSFS